MFAEERRRIILEKLKSQNKVLVNDLSEAFDVTKDCIRKDLKILENQLLIERTYGGAIYKRKIAKKSNMNKRKSMDVPTKKKIAKKAIKKINNNDIIFLDISSTNIYIAEELINQSKSLTVITNMIDILNVLKLSMEIDVIFIGGKLNKSLQGFVGSMAINQISHFKVNKSFIGSCGVNLEDESISTFEVDDGNTKKAIIKNSQETFLVMDNTKFNYDGTYIFSTLKDFNHIITDNPVTKKQLDVLSNLNINVL